MLDFSKQEVSFVVKIKELHPKNAEEVRQLRERESKAEVEFQKKKQMIECEISRLQTIVQ